MDITDRINWKPKWIIERFANHDDYLAGKRYSREEALTLFGIDQITEIDCNLLLNAGITVLLNLLGGIAATAFSNANAYIGVGDSTTAAAAAQTGLQAAANKTYKAMAGNLPPGLGANDHLSERVRQARTPITPGRNSSWRTAPEAPRP